MHLLNFAYRQDVDITYQLRRLTAPSVAVRVLYSAKPYVSILSSTTDRALGS